jgi:nicotinamidase/pyrazinamidase
MPLRSCGGGTSRIYVDIVNLMTIDYDAKTALVVVDVQNDFADPAGSLSVPGGDDVVEVVNAEIAAAKQAGATVVYTQDWHPPRTPHFVTDGGPWPVHCVAGSWGAELHPRLTVDGPAVRKGSHGEDGYSGFTMRDVISGDEISTGLDELLRERGITRVVVVGLALDYCVKATALDAIAMGYNTVVPVAATAPVEVAPGDGARAEAEMAEAGVAVAA